MRELWLRLRQQVPKKRKTRFQKHKPNENKPEPPDMAAARRLANRCLVCAPTNIAVQEILRRLLGRLGDQHWCSVVLVAAEDRANITWSDELRGERAWLAAVLLDHRKKRVKRLARFWLGEGFENAKPYLRQPRWSYEANSCFALLVSDPVKSFTRCHPPGKGTGKRGQATLEVVSLLQFVHQRLRDIRDIVQQQQARLDSDVAFTTKEFSPFFCTKSERRKLAAEAQVFATLVTFREQLAAFGRHLSELLEVWELDAGAAKQQVELPLPSPRRSAAWTGDPPEVEAGGSAGSDQASMMRDRKRAYCFVQWVVEGESEAKATALEGLIELMGLDAAPTATQSEEAFIAAEKRLKLLLHPDKAPADMQLVATAAFQDRDKAMTEVRKFMRCSDGASPEEEDSATFVSARRFETTMDPRLRSWLSNATLEALDSVLAVHLELLHASRAVRTASSTFLKGALLRRAALVFCTLTVAGRSSICGQQIPTVLIDEACQACEAETLLALRSWVQRLFLVGDPRQLPATISSPAAKRACYARSMWPRRKL